VKKILFIGNSHLATLKSAELSGIAEADYIGFSLQPEFNFDTYENTADGEGIKAPIMQRHFWNVTTKSAEFVDLAHYDYFFVVGLLPPPNPWLCLEDSSACDIQNTLLSYNTCSSIFSNEIEKDLNLARYIQAVVRKSNSSRKVFFIPLPYMREDYDKAGIKGISQPAEWLVLSDKERADLTFLIDQYYYRFLAGHNINLLRLSSELRTNGNLCPLEYSVQALGSKNFNSGKNAQWGDGDLYHKNKKYGKMLWSDINILIRNDLRFDVSRRIIDDLHSIRTVHGTQLFYDESKQVVVHSNNHNLETGLHPVLLWHSKGFDILFYFSYHVGLVRLRLDGNSQRLVVLDEGQCAIDIEVVHVGKGFGIKNLVNDYFFSANSDGTFVCNREVMKTWETLSLER